MQQISHVDARLDQRTWARITQEVSDDLIQSIRLAEDDLHQLRLRRIILNFRTKHLDRSAHRGERVTYLVCRLLLEKKKSRLHLVRRLLLENINAVRIV